MYAKDFRALARQALAGRWGVAVGTGLVALLLGGTIGSSASTGSSSSVGNYVQEHDLSVYIPDFVWMALVFLAAICPFTLLSALSSAAQSSLAMQSLTLPSSTIEKPASLIYSRSLAASETGSC